MKKIAMLNCLKTNNSCSGDSCIKYLYNRRWECKRYKEGEVELIAFMRCNRSISRQVKMRT